LALEKMNLEMERTRGEIDRQRILTRQMTDVQRNVNQGFNSGLSGGAATNAPQTPAQPRFRPFGTSAPQTSQEEMVTI
jgi:hypothetical protein